MKVKLANMLSVSDHVTPHSYQYVEKQEKNECTSDKSSFDRIYDRIIIQIVKKKYPLSEIPGFQKL